MFFSVPKANTFIFSFLRLHNDEQFTLLNTSCGHLTLPPPAPHGLLMATGGDEEAGH